MIVSGWVGCNRILFTSRKNKYGEKTDIEAEMVFCYQNCVFKFVFINVMTQGFQIGNFKSILE